MPDLPPILGLHHVTAISSDAAATHAFYTSLGLSLVKQTVNFDDPTSLHLYYGDKTGSPGSIVTLFVHPGAPQGQVGYGAVTGFGLMADPAALDVARRHAPMNHDPAAEPAETADPDGLAIRVDAADSPTTARPQLDGVTLAVADDGPTADFLAQRLGLRLGDTSRNQQTLTAGAGLDADPVAIDSGPARRHRPGTGTVHHVAFRVADAEGQLSLRASLVAAGVNVSPVMDRDYFTSIYFREPGGVLLEVATDGPGFATDEPADALGKRLCLPKQFEGQRAELERVVPWIRDV